MFEKLSGWVDRFATWISIIACMVLFVTVGMQIFFRYALQSSIIWADELPRFLFVWIVWFGGSCALKRNDLARLTSIEDRVSPAAKKYMEILSIVLSGLFFVVFLLLSVRHISTLSQQFSPVMRIPMRFVYLAIPLGLSLMLIHLVAKIISLSKRKV